MVWTAPRTWVDGETPTATLFNTHLRDNQLILKTPFDSGGKLTALSSTYLADLDGSNLTGLAIFGGSNSFTAGTHSFYSAVLRVPVGSNKYGGTSGNKTAGSIWVESTALCHVDDTQDEWQYVGDSVSTPGAGYAGCVWLDTSDNRIHYVDALGTERVCLSSSQPHTDAAGDLGSIWTETYLHAMSASSVERQYHNDVSHSNHNDNLDHSDHDNHTDHGDYTDHDDSGSGHSDHDDGHVNHDDYSHADVYPHGDYTDYSDHDDDINWGGHDNHTDYDDYTDHDNVAADSRPTYIGPA